MHKPTGYRDLIEAIAILLDDGTLSLANPSEEEIAESMPATRSLNHNILMTGRNGRPIDYLGSPLTGGGVKVPHVHQLFLLAREEGAKLPEHYARFAKHVFTDVKLRDVDRTKSTKLERLQTDADEFQHRYLPIYKALSLTDAP
jgi:hypothetical protein